MKTGTYRAATGELVAVTKTETGYVVRYPDGRTVSVGGRK